MDYETPIYDLSSPTTVQTNNELREQNTFTLHLFITPTTTYNSELNVLYLPPQAAINHPLREEAVSVTKMKAPVVHPKQKMMGKSICSRVERTHQCMRSARQNRLF